MHRLRRVARNTVELIRSGRTDLLLATVFYRCWRVLRGVDFSVVSVQDLGLAPERSYYHMESGGPLLRDLLRHLGITEADSVVDLGSGKGGAMVTLALFPFKQVDSVELSSDLALIARQNFRKLKLPRCRVFVEDAARFTDLDGYSYVFMFNPFPENVLREVLRNLEASLVRKPRSMRLLYSNALHAQTIQGFPTFKEILMYRPYSSYYGIRVYEARRS